MTKGWQNDDNDDKVQENIILEDAWSCPHPLFIYLFI